MPEKYKNKYRIPSARLQGYDYGQNGAYFITICTKNRIHYFGEIIDAVETQNNASQKTHDNLPQETQNNASQKTHDNLPQETQNNASQKTHDNLPQETHNNASQKTHDNLPQETHNNASLRSTPIGIIANEYWQKIPKHFPFVILDEFVVMPNHVHGILIINKQMQDASVIETQNIASLQVIGYTNKFGPQSGNISSVIRGYKASVKSFSTTNKIDFGWQPRFYDRIIRDYDEMKRIRKYIVENPDNWFRDRNNKEDLYM